MSGIGWPFTAASCFYLNRNCAAKFIGRQNVEGWDIPAKGVAIKVRLPSSAQTKYSPICAVNLFLRPLLIFSTHRAESDHSKLVRSACAPVERFFALRYFLQGRQFPTIGQKWKLKLKVAHYLKVSQFIEVFVGAPAFPSAWL